MSQAGPQPPPAAPTRRRPLQFTLRFLFFYTTVSAVFLSCCQVLGAGFGLAIFAICFFGFMMFVLGLMTIAHSDYVTVYLGASEAEATICRNFLEEHGIAATVVPNEISSFIGLPRHGCRVVAAPADADRARQLVAGPAAVWDRAAESEGDSSDKFGAG